MVILRADFAEIMPDLKRDEAQIKKTLEALSMEGGERYISLGIGRNLLPLIIAMQGVNVIGIDTSPDVLAFQMQMLDRFGRYLSQSHGSFEVYNLNFDDPYTGTKPIPGFSKLDYDKIRDSFDRVECVYFNHRESAADLAQILLSLAKPSARFFVSAPGGHIGPLDRTAQALINATGSKSDRPRLEVVATGLYVSTYHSNNYGVVLKPSSQI